MDLGDIFGNGTGYTYDASQVFDPSSFNFGNDSIPEFNYDSTYSQWLKGLDGSDFVQTIGGASDGIDWSKLGGNALKWLTTGTGKDGQGIPPWAALLGAGLGAMDSKDKTATSDRAPWAPMQPYLLGLAEDGRGLYNQYKAQPFSQAQQAAYGNVGGLLDVLNANAGGLLQGMQANATGQNSFVRGQPRRLQGSAQIDGTLFAPGLLGNFGTRG